MWDKLGGLIFSNIVGGFEFKSHRTIKYVAFLAYQDHFGFEAFLSKGAINKETPSRWLNELHCLLFLKTKVNSTTKFAMAWPLIEVLDLKTKSNSLTSTAYFINLWKVSAF